MIIWIMREVIGHVIALAYIYKTPARALIWLATAFSYATGASVISQTIRGPTPWAGLVGSYCCENSPRLWLSMQ
jgi:hypothetical protein